MRVVRRGYGLAIVGISTAMVPGPVVLVNGITGSGGVDSVAAGATPPKLGLLADDVSGRAFSVPADCQPAVAGPPTSPYELGTFIQVGDPPGGDSSVKPGSLNAGAVVVAGISADVCGILTVLPSSGTCPFNASISIPADGQSFVPLTAGLDSVPNQPVAVPLSIVPAPIAGSVGCGSSAGGLVIPLNASIEGVTNVFGVQCAIGPAREALTGTISGFGPNPQGSGAPYSDLRGTLTGSVQIPPVTPSPTCPEAVATNIDQLAGLPLSGTIDLPFKAAIYLPGEQP